MNYLELLKKRYSVKKFDTTRTISEDALKNILEAGKLSASSQGLQPYKIFVISSKEMKQKLVSSFYNPLQVSTCSHLIILITKKVIEDGYIKKYFENISQTREVPIESLEKFRFNITSFLGGFSKNSLQTWAEKQAYLVLGNLMFAAAMEKVDTCPMEGFKQKELDKVLDLDIEKEKVCVTLALGYRSEEDEFQNLKKVRKPNEKLFKFL